MSRRFELWEYAHDNNGDPVAGTLEFFDGGSSFGTPKDVFSDAGLTTPIAQPIEANSAGRWPDIFMSAALYDVRQTVGNVILTRANYDPGLAAGFGVSSVVGVPQGGTGADNEAAARNNLGVPSIGQMTAAQDSITAIDTQLDPLGGDPIGTAAIEDIGTSGATVPLLNGTNTHSALNTFSSTSGILARNTVKAYANFSVSGTTVSFTAANYFNIASITRTGEGVFDVVFTTALPTANYIVLTNAIVEGNDASATGEATSKTTAGFTITFRQDSSASAQDVAPGDILVIGF